MTRTIRVETELPTSADKVWDAMKHPVSFLYVTRGLVGFPALAGRTDPVRPGEVGTGWVLAFNVIPAYRHTIEVLDVDEATRSIRTHEYGGILRRWDHSLHAETISETRCRYSDTVVIDAGPLTRLVALVAIGIYRYRQRRWHRLVGKQLLPTGPRYSPARDPRCHLLDDLLQGVGAGGACFCPQSGTSQQVGSGCSCETTLRQGVKGPGRCRQLISSRTAAARSTLRHLQWPNVEPGHRAAVSCWFC